MLYWSNFFLSILISGTQKSIVLTFCYYFSIQVTASGNLSGAVAFFRKIKTDSHNGRPFWLHVSGPLLHVGWVFSEKVTVSVITAGQYGFVACSEEDVLCGGRNSSSSSSGPGQQMGKAKKQQSGWESVYASQTYRLSATTELAQHMTCTPSNATVSFSVFQWLTPFCSRKIR